TAGSHTTFVTAVDVNGDGIPDLITANGNDPGTVSVLLNRADWPAHPRLAYFGSGGYPAAISVPTTGVARTAEAVYLPAVQTSRALATLASSDNQVLLRPSAKRQLPATPGLNLARRSPHQALRLLDVVFAEVSPADEQGGTPVGQECGNR